MNIESHNISTGQRNNVYLPQPNLTTYQKAAYYSGIKIFNLPTAIEEVSDNSKKFKVVLEHFLHVHSFYTLEEYYNR
jgi:hypothetical protein